MKRPRPRGGRGTPRTSVPARPATTLELDDRALVFRVSRKLESPNAWRYSWVLGHKLTKWWEHALGEALLVAPRAIRTRVQQWQRQTPPRRCRVTVTRVVPAPSHFIRDGDNLRMTTKPVNDALKRLRLLFDDRLTWLDQDTPVQVVSPDGLAWTIVRIEPLDKETP